jgi:5-methylcytosine-specific restriction endonuclease McrA
MKWINEKETLNTLINVENKTYEEIGRIYNVTGEAIKKAAIRLGINIPKRRKVNPNEHFNKGTAKKAKCKNCEKEFIIYKSSNGIYCSHKCQKEFQNKELILKWQNGEKDVNKFAIPKFIKNYMLEKADYKCEKCGFNGVNPYTQKTILQIHHIDGNCFNNSEENLQVLCPNCHAMTENFGSRNKNAVKGRSKYFGKDKNNI